MSRIALLATASLLAAAAVSVTLSAPVEARPAPKPRLTATVKPVSEKATRVVIGLRLSSKAKRTVRIAWRTKDGTATAGADYRRSSGTVTIKKGRRTGTIRVRLLDDVADEPTQSFRVLLSSRGAKVPARPVTVRITDNDPTPNLPTAPTAPRALTGTVTVKQPVTVQGTTGTRTVTLSVRLVPTGAPGEWRDDGTGTWTASGTLTGESELCTPPSTTVSGAGGFLTGPGAATTDKAALVLTGFVPATATGTPGLSLDGVSTTSTTVAYPLFVPPNTFACTPSSSSSTSPFTISAPGAPGTYTGTTPAGRGLAFVQTSPDGSSVTGVLTPVS